MDTFQTIIIIYVFALIANSVNTLAMWYHNRNPLYKTLGFIWFVTMANFALQGVFDKLDIKTLISFSTYNLTSILLVELFAKTQKKHFHKTPYFIAWALGLIVGCGILLNGGTYMLAAIPVSLAATAPMFVSSIRTLWNFRNMTYADRTYAVLLFINALHFSDYPFLRTAGVKGSIIGFSVALFILFSMSIFLPAFILRNLNREYTTRLEKEVSERTLSLTEKNKELLTITKENLSLINIVCHDMGTPLSVLNSNIFYFQNLVKNDDSGKMLPRFQMIQRSLKSMNDILEKVRNLEALKSGKLQVELSPVILMNELHEVVALFSERLQEKKLTVRWEQNTPDDLKVLADAAILRNQILNNLISNAIKFSEAQSEIKISTLLHENQVHIRIHDRGVGIPTTLISKLFDFETNTTRRGTQGERGTGFGLPLVKTCVEKFGGQIHVQSQVKEQSSEHGSVFTVELKKAA